MGRINFFLSALAFLSLIAISLATVVSGPSSFFSEEDKQNAIRSLVSYQKSDGSFLGLKNTYYAVSALSHLKSEVPEKAKVCEFAKGSLKVYDSESIFYQASILEQLKCGQNANDQVKEVLKKALKSDSLHTLYYGLSAVLLLKSNKHLEISEAEIKTVIDRILEREDEGVFKRTEDDSFVSILYSGLGLDALAQVSREVKLSAAEKERLTTLLNNAENILSLGEEKDGALYFTDDEINASPLQVTSAVIRGINMLSSILQAKVESFTEEEAVQIAEFFVRAKGASSPEDLFFTLEGLKHSASNQFTPLVLSLAQQSISASSKDGTVQVRLTDLWGAFATTAKVSVVQAALATSGDVVIRGKDLAQGKDSSSYVFDFLSTKPSLGFYQLTLSATPTTQGKFVGISGAVRPLKVAGSASVQDALLTITDSENVKESEGRKYKVQVDSKLKEKVSVGPNQHIHLEFSVKSSDSHPVQVHQAFLRLAKDDLEVFLPAQYSNGAYYIHTVVKDLAREFYGNSGSYSAHLIVGDAFLTNPVSFEFATLALTFPEGSQQPREVSPFRVLPNIEHQFRVPEKRPSESLSWTFTLIVLSPIALLVIGLPLVGANLSNFPFNAGFLWAIGFQATLGAILGLFVIYWLRLTMVQTLGYLAALAVPFLFFSQRHLSSIAKQKTE